LSTDSNSVCDTSIHPPISTSDHNVTIFRLSNNNASGGTEPYSHFYYNWSKANFTGLTEHLLAIDWNNVFQYCFSVDQCWDAFIDIIHKGLEMYVPVALYKNQATPKKYHYPRFINRLIKEKLIAWKRWKYSQLTDDKLHY